MVISPLIPTLIPTLISTLYCDLYFDLNRALDVGLSHAAPQCGSAAGTAPRHRMASIRQGPGVRMAALNCAANSALLRA